jgi:hypothetical protein
MLTTSRQIQAARIDVRSFRTPQTYRQGFPIR